MDGLLNGANLNTLLSLGSLPFLLNHNIQLANLAMLNNNQTSLDNSGSKQHHHDENNNQSGGGHLMSHDENEDAGPYYQKHRKQVAFNRIFVSYPKEATEYELNAAFRPFGTIVHLHVIRDYATKTDKGS